MLNIYYIYDIDLKISKLKYGTWLKYHGWKSRAFKIII